MYRQSKKYFEEALEKIAVESAEKLRTMESEEKHDFLHDLSAKQLKRILPHAVEHVDSESAVLIKDIITARGYTNEL